MSKKNVLLLWDGEQVLTVNKPNGVHVSNWCHVLDMHCVDLAYPAEHKYRNGMYIKKSSEGCEWKCINLNNFPKEFQMHLLLLN